jgi:hypothetical protein
MIRMLPSVLLLFAYLMFLPSVHCKWTLWRGKNNELVKELQVTLEIGSELPTECDANGGDDESNCEKAPSEERKKVLQIQRPCLHEYCQGMGNRYVQGAKEVLILREPAARRRCDDCPKVNAGAGIKDTDISTVSKREAGPTGVKPELLSRPAEGRRYTIPDTPPPLPPFTTVTTTATTTAMTEENGLVDSAEYEGMVDWYLENEAEASWTSSGVRENQ